MQGPTQAFPWRAAAVACGPLRLIRYKPSQLTFHHSHRPNQTRPCRPLLPSDACAQDPAISRVPAAVETRPSFFCLHCTPSLPSTHTLFGGELVDGDWGRGRRGEGRNTVGVSSLLFIECNYIVPTCTQTRMSIQPSNCRLFCRTLSLSRPLLRGCSGGRLPSRPEYVGVCWGIGDRHVIIPAGQSDVLHNPDTHCRTVPCCSLSPSGVSRCQSPVGQETE